MLQRPVSTILPEQQFLSSQSTHPKFTANGPAQAAKEMFPCDPVTADPQTDAAVSLGTTIMAVAYDGGVVLAADSRTSTGTYVVNRAAKKLTRLTDSVYCCRSGSAADTQNLSEMVVNYLQQQEISGGRTLPVASAATIFQKLCYMNKWNISAGIIVAGYDETNGGSVYSIPSGGSCVRLPYALGGSGSIFLYSFMDANYRIGMTKDECLDLCRRAVSHALTRDGSSGGLVRTMCISKDGAEAATIPWTRIPYALERDEQYKDMAQLNPPPVSNSKYQGNVTDSSTL